MLAAGLENQAVDFNQPHPFDRGVPKQLSNGASVSAADDERAPNARMNEHRNVGDHLVVHPFITFADHHDAVVEQHPTEALGFDDVDLLEIALARVQRSPDLVTQAEMPPMKFFGPQLETVFGVLAHRDSNSRVSTAIGIACARPSRCGCRKWLMKRT